MAAPQFESLFVGADNEKTVDNFNLRTEYLLTDLFTDKEDSGRGITTVTDKEIQARNEARIPQNTKRVFTRQRKNGTGPIKTGTVPTVFTKKQ